MHLFYQDTPAFVVELQRENKKSFVNETFLEQKKRVQKEKHALDGMDSFIILFFRQADL